MHIKYLRLGTTAGTFITGEPSFLGPHLEEAPAVPEVVSIHLEEGSDRLDVNLTGCRARVEFSNGDVADVMLSPGDVWLRLDE